MTCIYTLSLFSGYYVINEAANPGCVLMLILP
jgi:hypothetical protein